MSEFTETHRGTVYPWQCDHMGHMNVMWYTGKFDEATWNLMTELTLSRAWLAAHERGLVAVEQRTAYLRELLAGDVVSVQSAIVHVSARSMRFVHRLFDAATRTECAVTLLTGVHIDTRTRRACALPEQARQIAIARRTAVVLPWEKDPSAGSAEPAA